ncbi:MAG: hypothetical protein WBQ14_07780 [Gaiellaceae bacterium]
MRRIALSLSLFGLTVVIAATAGWIGARVSSGEAVYELAFSAYKRNSADSGNILYLARADGSSRRRVLPNVVTPLWSPDGRLLADGEMSWPGDGIRVMSADGKSSRKIADFTGHVEGWSPQGDEVLTFQSGLTRPGCHSDCDDCCGDPCMAPDRYALVRISDGKTWPLVSWGPLDGWGWMPDGSLVVAGGYGGAGKTSVYLVRPDHSIRNIAPLGSDIGMPQVSRDGQTVVVWGRRRPYGRLGYWLLDPGKKTLGPIHTGSRSTLDIGGNLSPGGHWIAFDCAGICIADVNDGRVRRLSSFPSAAGTYLTDIAWSPNSRTVGAILRSDESRNQLALVDADGSDLHFLLTESWSLKFEESFAWSPDSRWIAFLGGIEWSENLHDLLGVMRADGSGYPIKVAGSNKTAIWNFFWRPVPASD